MAKAKKKVTKANSRQKKGALSEGRSTNELKDLALGQSNTEYLMSYAPEVLETFPNKNPGHDAWTTFVCTEFTSLCPKTNQPDFARIYINYIADDIMVE